MPEVAELFAGGPQANLAAVAAFFADRQRAGQVRTEFQEHSEALFLTSSFVFKNAKQAAARFTAIWPMKKIW